MRTIGQSKWKQFRTVRYGGNPSKVAVATSKVMNIKLKILVIESRINTYSSSSEYKISTVQVNSYKAWTSPSYKVCRITKFVVNKDEQGSSSGSRVSSLSKKASSKGREIRTKTWLEKPLKHKGQPPLNRQNSEWTVSWIVTDEQWQWIVTDE